MQKKIACVDALIACVACVDCVACVACVDCVDCEVLISYLKVDTVVVKKFVVICWSMSVMVMSVQKALIKVPLCEFLPLLQSIANGNIKRNGCM